MTELTILTPAYNRAGLLKNCYHSLLKQSCFDFEWIVVNDGSTDETGEVMREVCERVQKEYPDYMLQAAMDTDFSEESGESEK